MEMKRTGRPSIVGYKTVRVDLVIALAAASLLWSGACTVGDDSGLQARKCSADANCQPGRVCENGWCQAPLDTAEDTGDETGDETGDPAAEDSEVDPIGWLACGSRGGTGCGIRDPASGALALGGAQSRIGCD